MRIEESLKIPAKEMLDIILDDDSTNTEKIMARSTLFEIIAPNLTFLKTGPHYCVDCGLDSVDTFKFTRDGIECECRFCKEVYYA